MLGWLVKPLNCHRYGASAPFREADMDTAVYKPGGPCKVWGVMAHVKVVDHTEVENHVKDGWLDHPSKLLDKPVRRKAKAATDADAD